MSLILTGNSSTLTVDSTNGITFPNATLQTVAAQTGPAFSAYQTSAQTGITNNTPTKVTLETEVFDTNNNFSSSRFTPTVAGYYQFNYTVQIPYNNTSSFVLGMIYKNGTQAGQSTSSIGNPVTYAITSGSTLLYMNGSTDYVEMYVYGYPNTGSTFNISPGQSSTFFNGFLARAA